MSVGDVSFCFTDLTAWLKTAESKAVGFKATEGSESVGHHSGKQIAVLLHKPEGEFTDGDVAHAGKVVGNLACHNGVRLPNESADYRRSRAALLAKVSSFETRDPILTPEPGPRFQA